MSFLRQIAVFMILLTGAFAPLLAQCSSTKKQTFLVSDRYRDVARHGDQFLLANSYGLVVREINATDPTPLFIEPLPGDITRVVVSGDYVFAMAEGRGLHILHYETGLTRPVLANFVAIAGLSDVQVTGNTVFTYTRGKLTSYRFEPGLQGQADNLLIPIATLELEATQFFADASLLYVRLVDATVRIYSYSQTAITYLRPLTLNGANVFYGLYKASDRIIVDGLDGISWLTLTTAGQVSNSGALYTNSEGEIVLGCLAQGSHLFLRFADHIEVSRIDSGSRVPIGSIPQEFQDVGHVAIVATDTYLHLLNQAPQRRDWSLSTYAINSNVQSQVRLEALFEELVAGASTRDRPDRIYLASNRSIYLVDPDNQSSFRDQQPLVTVDGNIEDMVASDSLIYVTAPVPGSGFTRIYVYTVDADGSFRELNRIQVSGSVSQLSQYGDSLAFLRYLRKTSEDSYEINVLYRDNSGFQLSTKTETVPLGADNPFNSLHLGDLGLVYLRDNSAWVFDQPSDLGEARAQVFTRPFTINALVALRGHYWIQTEIGIYLYTADGDSAREVGYYPHWRALTRLSNNMILAQNVLRQNPGSFHLLALESGDLINDRVDFSTTDDPLFIAEMGDDILVGERASLNIFQFECPDQDYVYLMPVLPDMELDLNTTLDPIDVATMVIYNAAGEIIGLQDLDPDLIELLNTRKLSGWLFDYNNLETPATFVLMASRPMAPIISGFGSSSPRSRYAYRVTPHSSNELYLPHFPKDSTWSTRLVLRSQISGNQVTAAVLGPDNQAVASASFANGTTTSLTIPKSSKAPWLKIQSDNAIAGYALFQDASLQRAAAVPLASTPSNYLVLPYLSRIDNPSNWTGLALANPHPSETFVRLVGYDGNGQILQDRSEILAGNSSFVVNTESWLAGPDLKDDTRWLVTVSDQPIFGMVLYGNTREQQLAGMQLSGATGGSLLFAGIRTQSNWHTELRITNTDGVPGLINVSALSGSGQSLTTVSLPIKPNQNLGLDVATLFEALGSAEVRKIQTIRVTSTVQLTGLAFRSNSANQSLEAFSALVE